MATTTDQRTSGHRETERYREAATLTLEQLRRAINYLHQIRKGALAKDTRATIAAQAGLDH